MNLEDSYRNPFSDYNANVMQPSKILDYWCSPFAKSAEITESDIYRQGMPIVFMGGRGTGKTMFLRYFSYQVQRDEALKKNQDIERKKIISHLKKRGGIGFYLRIDGPVLRSFDGKGLAPDHWDAIFTHYFELQICKSYIEVIQDLVLRSELDKEQVEEKFVLEVARKLGDANGEAKTIEDILAKVEDELKEVASFRSQIAFSDLCFLPQKAFASQDLSIGVAEIAMNTINEFHEDINFVIFIDEYENFAEQQQRIINTLLKFIKPRITFRIGMRLEGFHTFDTISVKEFIKEGRDYSKIIFENFLIKDEDYQAFLKDVARRRLEAVHVFRNKGDLDISKFLGDKENLEIEAFELIQKRENPYKHFELLNFSSKKISVEETQKLIRYPDNPLLEMLNILWVIRNNKPEDVHSIMKDYLDGKKSDDTKKYQRDYVDKYKLSLMILLALVYKKHKKYYSFNTFCFLSSGIVGNFIELCRRSFQYAYFENREKLLEEGVIPTELQDRAARDLANSELEMIPRIREFGDRLYRFTMNLGNIFREYHKDTLVRYPETNQFSMDSASLDDDLKKAFQAALEWSIVQKRIGTKRTEIYILNRIFAPKFDISYRTRGGESGEKNYHKSELRALMTEDNVKPKMKLDQTRKARKKALQAHDDKLQKLSNFFEH